MANLVFIGHEASLTGAPYTQLYFLQWLKENTNHSVELILLRGGALEDEFRKVANVHVLTRYIHNPNIGQRLFRKAEAISNFRVKRILHKITKANPKLIFANTALTLELAISIKQLLGIPVLLHIHELETNFFYFNAAQFADNAKKVDFFIPCSNAVKDFYEATFQVPKDLAQVVYDFSELRPEWKSTAFSIRNEFNIPAAARIIGAGGALGWRKGTDLFLQTAYSMLNEPYNKDIYFIWLGADQYSIQYKELMHDARLMGIANRVLFIAPRTDLQGFYEAFDVFLLTSREDPFPLVCMEAALLECPIICFADGGGMPEFVQSDAGFVVRYCNIKEMGSKVHYLLENEDIRAQMGKNAKVRAEQYHTIRTIGPEMYGIVERFL